MTEEFVAGLAKRLRLSKERTGQLVDAVLASIAEFGGLDAAREARGRATPATRRKTATGKKPAVASRSGTAKRTAKKAVAKKPGAGTPAKRATARKSTSSKGRAAKASGAARPRKQPARRSSKTR